MQKEKIKEKDISKRRKINNFSVISSWDLLFLIKVVFVIGD